jgi:CubicO group peptidase (beta-lactamase class C family)
LALKFLSNNSCNLYQETIRIPSLSIGWFASLLSSKYKTMQRIGMPLLNRITSIATASLALVVLSACSGGSNENHQPQTQTPTQPLYDFSAVDTAFQQFLDDSATFDGISATLVDSAQGTVHEAAFGDHDLDIVVMLASTSKMPVASLLMALHEDESLNFDIERSIDNYLPWDGAYGDRTTVQLVSNTSGIPGLGSIGSYGPHMCQYVATGTLEACGETIYTNKLANSVPPGTKFDYGGSQWQLSGAVAEQVSNSSFAQAFDEYIATPCDLEVFKFGNMWSIPSQWTGSPDSLRGLDNPSIEGGAISNMRDYAKILLLHLRGGRCGDNQVLSADAVQFMQQDRAGHLGVNYGMGWWIIPGEGENTTIYYDPGAFGAVSWIDIERGIGGYVAIDDYSRARPGDVYALVLDQIIPLQQRAVDKARAALDNSAM